MSRGFRNLFINLEPVKILLTVRKQKKISVKGASEKTGVSQDYALDSLEMMAENGLVRREDEGYLITPYGKSLSESLLLFLDLAEKVEIQEGMVSEHGLAFMEGRL